MVNIKLRVKHIHFIGIGGSGMSGIAEVLHHLGYIISGSDISENANVERLKQLGIPIYNFHHQEHIKHIDAVVVSSAIAKDNVELKYAKKQGIPIVPRAEMLAEIMRFRFGIAISGTHGKTTTTSLIAHILHTAKLDPTYIIGGILNAEGVGNRLGSGHYIVAEADESDKSFLHLSPMISVITNIDADHMQTYNNNYGKLQKAFIDFTSRLPFYGLCAVCLDNEGVRHIIPRIKRTLITYGFDAHADIRAQNAQYLPNNTEYEVITADTKFTISTPLLGKHNVQNALAAIAICLELGVTTTAIQRALENFTGVKRRLDYKGNITIAGCSLELFDDYAHHPTEIAAVIESIKNAKGKEPIIIFQPHRYSRTQELFTEFVAVLQSIHNIIILPIYAAGESPLPSISSTALLKEIGHGYYAQNNDEVIAHLSTLAHDGDIVMTLGAGDITHLATDLTKHYAT